jgi:twitching motility two-component system response regulator PilH
MRISKVLIVDDSATDRETLRSMLQPHGYQVIMAADGGKGIVMARNELPDLILMDVVMPGVNGFEATRSLSREGATRHIPIIMCSGKNQPTDRAWGLRQGALAYFVKPVDARQLLDTIDQLGKAVSV